MAIRIVTPPPDKEFSPDAAPVPAYTAGTGADHSEIAMKVLIAPDKFKGSLTAAEVAHHLATGLEQRGIASRRLPLADGGDGS
jgi:hypothetical protein